MRNKRLIRTRAVPGSVMDAARTTTPSAACVLALVLGACSSSKDAGGAGGSGSGGAGGSSSGGAAGGSMGTVGGMVGIPGCQNPTLDVVFSPLYSAFDGTHMYKVPAFVNSVDEETVTWTASDMSMVDIVKDLEIRGIMITTRKAGKVNIIASTGSACGYSTLNILAATNEEWMIGSDRYTRGETVMKRPVDAGGTIEAACTSCHGDTATKGPYKTVSHTPEQTGGFSDEDLRNIITKAIVPPNSYFDWTVVSYETWQTFHAWKLSEAELKGIIVYLRSLTPAPQRGTRNRGDGGIGPMN